MFSVHLKKIILVSLFCFSSLNAFSQYKSVFRQKEFEKKFDDIVKLYKSNKYIDRFNVISQLKSFETDVLKSKNSKLIVDFYYNSASFLVFFSNFNLTNYYAKKGLYYSKKSKDYYFVGKFYEIIGVSFDLIGEESKSFEMILLSEKYLTKYAPLKDRLDLYYNLNQSYYRKKDWPKVLKYGFLHISNSEIFKEKKSITMPLFIAEAYINNNDLAKAYEYLKTIDINTIPKNQSYLSKCRNYYHIYGNYYMKIGDYKNASKMFLKAREFAEKERKKDLINSIEKARSEKKIQQISHELDKIKNENFHVLQNNLYKNSIIILGIVLIISLLIIIKIQKSRSAFKSNANAQLQLKNTELRNALEIKSKFLNTISHEFRTPLNAIMGTLSLLHEDENNSNKLKIIENSTNYLNNLINQFFEYNFISKNGLKLVVEEKIILEVFINNLIASFESLYLNKNRTSVSIDEKIHQNILFDSTRLTMVLNIILDNAFKFTDNGLIDVNLKLVESNEEFQKISFLINDTGIGISEEKIDNVYDLFSYGSDEINLLYGGTGIGLALADKIVKLYDSHIDIQSELGKGTSVSFCLNFKKDMLNVVEEALISEPIKDRSKIKVLVVEDNKINMLLVTQILKNNGFLFKTAFNGQEAVEYVEKEDFSIIIMDIMMPIMDGFEASLIISELKKEIPIVALTTISEDINKEKFENSNIKQVLNKPLNVDELLFVIDKHCY
jgi:signal transduction histidine kinase/CheY-like chemotaxis protein